MTRRTFSPGEDESSGKVLIRHCVSRHVCQVSVKSRNSFREVWTELSLVPASFL